MHTHKTHFIKNNNKASSRVYFYLFSWVKYNNNNQKLLLNWAWGVKIDFSRKFLPHFTLFLAFLVIANKLNLLPFFLFLYSKQAFLHEWKCAWIDELFYILVWRWPTQISLSTFFLNVKWVRFSFVQEHAKSIDFCQSLFTSKYF